MAEVIARRITGWPELDSSFMCYWKGDDGIWMLYIPGCGIGNLANHKVEEHEDQSITVTPSILVSGHNLGNSTEVHGYLTRGVWKDC